MVNTNLEKLQKVEIGILVEFIRICEEKHFTWFAIGGTTLGAVRHKGFIPWDDDIDVALPRKDYEEFLNVAQSMLPSNMFLQTYKTDENYPNVYAKIRKTDTTFIEKTSSSINMCHGVYIDVFPLDGYPKHKINRMIFHIKERILKIALSQAFEVENDPRNFAKKILVKSIQKAISSKKATVKLDLLFKRYPYESTDIIANFGGAWGKKEIMPKEIFGKGIKNEFEDFKVSIPQKAHEYLTLLYGDYMTPPPPQKRVGPHLCTVIDLDKPYIEYKGCK